MSNAKAVVEKAAFDALAAAITGATVFQDVPNDWTGDVVILGDMKSARLDTKDTSADRRVAISIIEQVEAEERAPLLALQDEVEQALDGRTIEVPGWSLSFAFVDDDAVLNDDGATYVGVTNFTVHALAD